jgi:ATP-dependent RNA helicase SUPV3L1/SUV3
MSALRAILGPTNTGKTHVALETCVQHASGVMGFPLRLLAREAYDRLARMVGEEHVALVTGEEKRIGAKARYFACTVEAMPLQHLERDFAFVAIDEVQLCADAERGHVFTDRVLHRRGTEATLLLGADTAAPVLQRLLPGLFIERRPRLSQLQFSGHKKLARLPKRSAVVAFSMAEVYRLAEEARHHHGGCAVVLGALSPRTRNAQVDMFQQGEVDVIVATDAIGLGLNLDIHHMAFAGTRKFDGDDWRALTLAEVGQIAGRAGRHVRDGTFGTTAQCPPFEAADVQLIEAHRFSSLSSFFYRNSDLDFSSVDALVSSLQQPPPHGSLQFGRVSSDLRALQSFAPRSSLQGLEEEHVERLWQVCQIPDFEKVSPDEHERWLWEVWTALQQHDGLRDEWLQVHFDRLDRGRHEDVETLLTKLTQVRSLSYVVHQRSFGASAHWPAQLLRLEDRMSDALHRALQQRFVDVLGRAVVTGKGLHASINVDGNVDVGGEAVGTLRGLRFEANEQGGRADLRTTAAAKALQGQLQERVQQILQDDDDAFTLDEAGLRMLWRGESVGVLVRGQSLHKPEVEPLLDNRQAALTNSAVRVGLRAKLSEVLQRVVRKRFAWLYGLQETPMPGAAKGMRYALWESLGVASRAELEREVGLLSSDERKAVTKAGVRLGFRDVYGRDMFKTPTIVMRALLWWLWTQPSTSSMPALPPPGASSFPLQQRPTQFVARCGFHVLGQGDLARAHRIDLLDQAILKLQAMSQPFSLPTSLCELLGCSRSDAEAVLQWCGYQSAVVDDVVQYRRRHRR